MPIKKHIATLAALAVLSTAAHSAFAQTQEDWRKTEEEKKPPSPELTLEQSYHGVTPGGGNNLPRIEELRSKPGTWVTWPGFLMLPDGGSRMFLQTTIALRYDLKKSKKALLLKLEDAHVHLSNNRNPLVTTNFNTPLDRAYLKKSRKSLDLIVQLRVAAEPKISQVTDKDGYHYMFLDFAPGNYPKIELADQRPSFSGGLEEGEPEPSAPEAQPSLEDEIPLEVERTE